MTANGSPPYELFGDDVLDARIDLAVERVQALHRKLSQADRERAGLLAERERRDSERGITRPGHPCRTCGACHRCYLGDHGQCHGCRCVHEGDGPRCDHGPTASAPSRLDGGGKQ